MSEKKQSVLNQENKYVFRLFAGFFIGFFLTMTVLTAFIVVPKINKALEKQHIIDSEATLKIETELFKRFVTNHRTILDGLAKFPVITSAALLSKSDNPDFIDLVDNFSIAGEKSRLILQNIAGDIIYQTSEDIKGNFQPDAPWIETILNGSAPYNFQLLEQEGQSFRFVISVPVIYLGHTEGILSAEITAPLTAIFSPQTTKDGGAFKLQQESVLVQTDMEGILLPREVSTDVVEKNIKLTYINDNTQVLEAQNNLRNTILLVLFSGMGISFLAFIILGYKSLTEEEAELSQSRIFSIKHLMPLGIGILGIAASITAALLLHNFLAQQGHQNNASPWVVFIVGSVFSGFVAYNFIQLMRRHQVIEAIVDKRTQEIKEAKNFQDLIMQNIPDLLFVKDNEFRIVDANPAFLNAYPEDMRDSVIGTTTIEKYAPEEAEEFLYHDKVALSEGTSETEETILFPDGETRTLRTKKVRFENNQGNIFVLGIGRDVTELQEAEKQLKILSASVENANDVVMITEAGNLDDGLKVIYVNEAFTKITGYEADEIIGKTPRMLQSSKTSRETLDDIRQHLEKQQPYRGEVLNKTKYDEEYWIDLNIFPIKDSDGNTLNYAAIERDITEQKKNETEREELRDAMENTVEGVSQIDPQGRYIYLNEAYASLCGYKPEELTGKNWEITVHADDHEMMNQAYQVMIEAGKVTEEPRGLHKDGSTFHKRVTMISRYNDNGEFIGHHCFMSDISDRKQAEEEILRSNEELERFAYVASHDLQEPLRMVTNFTGLLDKQYGDQLDDIAKEYLNYAFDGARRMQDLINDLLEYARIGQEAENFKDIELAEILKLAQENLSESISASGAEIHYDADNLPTLHTNPVRLLRVIQNIIGNGIKYQTPDGKPEIHIEAKEQDGMWMVSMHDNGIGMKQEYCEKIFEPFKRLHGKNEYTGTGMGLAICRKIIEGFDGNIWAESTLGEGTTFYFTVPLMNKKTLTDEEKAA